MALDRLVRLAELDSRAGDVEGWRAARDEIRALVEREGVDDAVFTQSFGDGGKLDASNLMIPMSASCRTTIHALGRRSSESPTS